MKLSEAVQIIIEALQLECTEANRRLYELVMGKFLNVLPGDTEIEKIAPHHVNHAMLAILDPEFSPSTTEKYKRTVRAFFNRLVEMGYLERSPVKFKIKVITPGPLCLEKAIPDEDIDKMLNHANNARDYALVRVLADTGLRRGAVHRLRVSYIRFAERHLNCLEKLDQWHVVPLVEETAEALTEWLAEREKLVPKPDHGFVFVRLDNGEHLAYDSMKSILQRIAERAGVERYGAHGFRHAWGVWAAGNGIPVTETQSVLGHARGSTTWDFYYKSSPEAVRKTVKKRARRNGGH